MRKMGEACMICMTGPSRKRGGSITTLPVFALLDWYSFDCP